MRKLLEDYRMILTYAFHSALSTAADVAVVWILFHTVGISIAAANTCGVLAGFILGLFLNIKKTFHADCTPLSVGVYLGTFFIGLAIADFLIAVTLPAVENILPPTLAFLFSKGVSAAAPFFVMYVIRKYAYQTIHKRREQ